MSRTGDLRSGGDFGGGLGRIPDVAAPVPSRACGAIFVCLAIMGFGGADAAIGKGPFVVAPERLTRAACEQGQVPPETYSDGDPQRVIGCARFPSDRELYLYADREEIGRAVCLYAAAPGHGDYEGPCWGVDRGPGGRFALPFFRVPLTGDRGVYAYRAGNEGFDGRIYLVGQASPDVHKVTISYVMPSRESREIAADLVRIQPGLARWLGLSGTLSLFAGDLPARADTCAGIRVEGRTVAGSLIGRDRFIRGNQATYSHIALPGSPQCETLEEARSLLTLATWMGGLVIP